MCAKFLCKNSNEVSPLSSVTSSIYDLQWRDNNVILTGHYDTTFRLFDCRTNRDEHIWLDPYDLAIYSISHDGNYGVLCGMKYHCRVNLYDLRVSDFRFVHLSLRKNVCGTIVYSNISYFRYRTNTFNFIFRNNVFVALKVSVHQLIKWLMIKANYSLQPITIYVFSILMLIGLNPRIIPTFSCTK